MENYIEKWIQFAIDNGYWEKYNWLQEYSNDNGWCYEDIFDWEFVSDNKRNYISIERLITSKKFIEAIARGYIKNNNPTKYWEVEWIGRHRNKHWTLHIYDEILEQITHLQAIAIRDGKLEEFIQKTLNLTSKSI